MNEQLFLQQLLEQNPQLFQQYQQMQQGMQPFSTSSTIQNNQMQGITQQMWDQPMQSTLSQPISATSMGAFPVPQGTTVSYQGGFPNGDYQYRPEVSSVIPQGFETAGVSQISPEQRLEDSANTTLNANSNPTSFQGQPNNNAYFFNALGNAFTPMSTESSVFKLGQSLSFNQNNPYASQGAKNWNTVRGIGAAGKTLTSLLRTGFAGAAFQNLQNQATTDYYNRQGMQDFVPLSYENGGTVSQEQFLTNAYIGEVPTGVMPNAVIENNEYVQTPQGNVQQAVGATHEAGGIPTTLEPGSRVISDNLKLGGKTARELKKEFDIDIKANNTFAEAISKYQKKIGLEKLNKEQEDLFKKVETKTEIEDQQTNALNEQFLAKKIQETELAKAPLSQQLSSFTDILFQKQEELKGNTTELQFENGGTFTGNQLKDLFKKHNLTEEQGMQMISGIKQYADGGEYPFFNQSPYAQSAYGNQTFVPGMTNAAGITQEEILARLQAQNQTLPYIVNNSGIYSDNAGTFPNLNNTAKFQQNYDNYVQATIAEIEANPYLSAEEKARTKTLAASQVLGISKKSGQYDNIYGQETSSRSGFVLPYLKKEDKEKYSDLRFLGDAVDEKGAIKDQYKDLSPETKKLLQDTYKRSGVNALNIGLGEVNDPVIQIEEATASTNTMTVPQNRTQFGGLNLLDQSLPPPSGLQPARLSDAQYRNYEAVAQGYEPQLQQLYNQESAAIDSLAGLSPGQRAAAIAQISGNTQGQAMNVIGQVNNTNQVEQARISNGNVDLFNRYAVVDENERERYEQKMFAGLANQEQSYNNFLQYNNQLAAINRQQQLQANTLANLFPNVSFSPDAVVGSNGITPQLYLNSGMPTQDATYAKRYLEEKAKLDARKANK